MTKTSRPRFKTSPQNLKRLARLARKLHRKDLCERKVESTAISLLSELRTMGLNFSDASLQDPLCLACLDLSLGDAASKLTELAAKLNSEATTLK